MRSKNLDALERMEREKVRIAGDNVGRLAAHRKFEELVVLRITASCYPCMHIDPLSLARQGCQETSNIFLIHIAAEPSSVQNFVEFGKRRKGKQNLAFLKGPIECLAGF